MGYLRLRFSLDTTIAFFSWIGSLHNVAIASYLIYLQTYSDICRVFVFWRTYLFGRGIHSSSLNSGDRTKISQDRQGVKSQLGWNSHISTAGIISSTLPQSAKADYNDWCTKAVMELWEEDPDHLIFLVKVLDFPPFSAVNQFHMTAHWTQICAQPNVDVWDKATVTIGHLPSCGSLESGQLLFSTPSYHGTFQHTFRIYMIYTLMVTIWWIQMTRRDPTHVHSK